MGISDPAGLSSVLGKVFNKAGQQALEDPGELGDLLKKVLTPGQNVKLPDLDPLRQPPFKPPQWRSLLVVLMRWMVDEINEPDKLWLGAHQPPGWVPMLTLNYSPNSAAVPLISVGLAVTDQGTTTPPLKQGIWLDVHPGLTEPLKTGALSLTLTVGPSAGSWHYDFTTGTLSPLLPVTTPPPTVTLLAQWDPGWHLESTIFPSLSTGTANVELTLTTATPMYRVRAGVGPLTAHFEPGAALGPLAAAVNVVAPSVSYRPQVTIAQGAPPSFTLGG